MHEEQAVRPPKSELDVLELTCHSEWPSNTDTDTGERPRLCRISKVNMTQPEIPLTFHPTPVTGLPVTRLDTFSRPYARGGVS